MKMQTEGQEIEISVKQRYHELRILSRRISKECNIKFSSLKSYAFVSKIYLRYLKYRALLLQLNYQLTITRININV